LVTLIFIGPPPKEFGIPVKASDDGAGAGVLVAASSCCLLDVDVVLAATTDSTHRVPGDEVGDYDVSGLVANHREPPDEVTEFTGFTQFLYLFLT
jgi:hypothetical protein